MGIEILSGNRAARMGPTTGDLKEENSGEKKSVGWTQEKRQLKYQGQ